MFHFWIEAWNEEYACHVPRVFTANYIPVVFVGKEYSSEVAHFDAKSSIALTWKNFLRRLDDFW